MNGEMHDFEYIQPSTVADACAVLSERSGAAVLAGGSDILVHLKHGLMAPSVLVDIRKIPGLDTIEVSEDAVRIGPLTTLKALQSHAVIARQLPALAKAASVVGSYHHQVMGTVGGNICQENRCSFLNQSASWRQARPACLKTGGGVCHVVKGGDRCFACYHGDLAPVLIAMGARVVLAEARGTRCILLEQLYTGNGNKPIDKRQSEIVVGVEVPSHVMAGRSLYLKSAARGSIDFPVVGLAVYFAADGGCRICYTAVDTAPVRARSAEAVIAGNGPDRERMTEILDSAVNEARPVKNTFCPPAVKRDLMKKLLGQALNRLAEEKGS